MINNEHTNSFTYTGSIEFAKFSIGDIVIAHSENNYIYKPQKDITNIELAHLMKMFTVLALSGGSHRDYGTYEFIQVHGLERHFEKIGE